MNKLMVAAVCCALGTGTAFAKGALLLSFDDRNFAGWTNAIPLFEKYDAHATFFASGAIDAQAVAAMRELDAHGHAVGLHGLRHANADELLAKVGPEEYYRLEVEPQVTAARARGLTVRNYAYPNCRHSEETDRLLFAKGFHRLRAGSGLTPYDPKHLRAKEWKPLAMQDAAFLPCRGVGTNRLMKGVIVGEAYNTRIDDIVACVRRAAANDELFQIISHDIAPDARSINMKTEWLEAILKTAQELNVHVISYDRLGGDFKEVTPPVVMAANADWIPLHDTTRIAPGSALDFSRFLGARVPAGTYGRVVVKGKHFEFEKKPGVPQRFYGINITDTGLFQGDADSTELADRLLRMGYNAMRIHFQDGVMCTGDDGLTFIPERVDELDALTAKLIKRGFYITADVYTSRRVKYRALGIDKDGFMPTWTEMASTAAFNPRVEANIAAFARKWLGHVNPYTGRRWADEPALMCLSLVNENNVSPNGTFRSWVGVTKEQVSDADLPQWITDRIRAFDARMIRVLREEIGYRGPITGLNNYDPPIAEYNRAREQYDYVDAHLYVDLPSFPSQAWHLPSRCDHFDPLAVATRGNRWDRPFHMTRDWSKPYVISEFNHAAPGKYRSSFGLIWGAGAASSDVDAMWRFAWLEMKKGAVETKPEHYFQLCCDPIGRANERAILALFLRRDQPADHSIGRVKGPVFTVNTPCTRGTLREGDPVAVHLISLDGAPLERSKRVLVSHLTDVRNTGMTFRDVDERMLEAWGTLPHLMKRDRREVTVPAEGARKVWALAADGTRRREVPSVFKDGAVRFTADVAADPAEATYLYEVGSD